MSLFSLLIKYSRKYFISIDNSIRVTLDNNIVYTKPDLFPFRKETNQRICDACIVEFKHKIKEKRYTH